MDEANIKPARKKLAFEVVFELLRQAGVQALEQVPELRSLLVIADWEVGENDFPAGTSITRDNEKLGPDALCSRQRQLIKIQLVQIEKLNEFLDMGKQLLSNLSAQVTEKHKELSDIKSRVDT